MNGRDLRAAMRELTDDVRTPDLLDRALATSGHIRRRRIVVAAGGTAAGLAVIVALGSMIRPPDTTVAPPASESATSAVQTTRPTPSATQSAAPPPATSAHTSGSPPVPATALPGTAYYLESVDLGTRVMAREGDEQPRRISDSVDWSIAVSPDGRLIARTYPGDVDPQRGNKLIAGNVDGTDERVLADAHDSHGLCNIPAWSPDSRRVLYQPPGDGLDPAGVRWAIMDVQTGANTMLDQPTGCYPVWSPDGATIGWYTGSNEVLLTDTKGGNRRQLRLPETPGCAPSIYALSPGARLALVSSHQPGQACGGDGPGRTAHDGVVVDTATGQRIDLPVAGPVSSGVFTQDGSLLVRADQTNELVLLDPQLRILARTPTLVPAGNRLILQAFVPDG